MRSVAAAMGVLAFVLGLAGCNVRHDGDAVTRQFGSDYFGAGGAMNLTDSVAGDAFVAGGHVTTASDVRGDLVVAGGEVSIGGAVGDDLYAAGGEVQLDAIVSGNARVVPSCSTRLQTTTKLCPFQTAAALQPYSPQDCMPKLNVGPRLPSASITLPCSSLAVRQTAAESSGVPIST